jgi:hypothetical protein
MNSLDSVLDYVKWRKIRATFTLINWFWWQQSYCLTLALFKTAHFKEKEERKWQWKWKCWWYYWSSFKRNKKMKVIKFLQLKNQKQNRAIHSIIRRTTVKILNIKTTSSIYKLQIYLLNIHTIMTSKMVVKYRSLKILWCIFQFWILKIEFPNYCKIMGCAFKYENQNLDEYINKWLMKTLVTDALTS